MNKQQAHEAAAALEKAIPDATVTTLDLIAIAGMGNTGVRATIPNHFHVTFYSEEGWKHYRPLLAGPQVTARLRTLESGEPVFMLRAQDVLALGTIQHWIARAVEEGVSPDKIDGARFDLAMFAAWQDTHVTKLPD